MKTSKGHSSVGVNYILLGIVCIVLNLIFVVALVRLDFDELNTLFRINYILFVTPLMLGSLLIIKGIDFLKYQKLSSSISAYFIALYIAIIALIKLSNSNELYFYNNVITVLIVIALITEMYTFMKYFQNRNNNDQNSKGLSLAYYLVMFIFIITNIFIPVYSIGSNLYRGVFGIYYENECYSSDCIGELVKLNGVDYWTFKIIERSEASNPGNYRSPYVKDKNHVYYFSNYYNGIPAGSYDYIYRLLILEGSDPKTFTPINSGYSKDATHVYFFQDVVEGAVAKDFEYLNLQIYTDYKNLYYNGKIIATYEPNIVIKDRDNGYLQIQNNIYYYGKKLEGVDAATFKNSSRYDWVQDSKSVWRLGERIENLDAQSFVELSRCYIKDRNNVFYTGGSNNSYHNDLVLLENADTSSFEITNDIGYCNGKDKNHKYWDDEIVYTYN